MISVRRGTNKKIKFQRRGKDGTVITDKPDEVYFTVKKDCCYSEALFQKKLTDNEITFSSEDNYYRLELFPEDTEELGFGDYQYDIKIIYTIDGVQKKKTIIVDQFKIERVVTYAINESGG